MAPRENIIADPAEQERVVMEIRDNWYVTYQESNGRVLSVGIYLPPPADGVKTVQLPWRDPAILRLLQQFNTRWHGEQVVGTIVNKE
jgi:hypothetical protein